MTDVHWVHDIRHHLLHDNDAHHELHDVAGVGVGVVDDDGVVGDVAPIIRQHHEIMVVIVMVPLMVMVDLQMKMAHLRMMYPVA